MRMRNLLPVAAAAAIVVSSGCSQLPKPVPRQPTELDAPVSTVIQRVNANSQAMAFLLRGESVTATGQYIENGKRESFELKGTLLYRKPRDLFLQLQHTLGGKMEIGSNAEEFWVWKKLGSERYWWGRHEEIDESADSDMPLRPDHLLEVLGLQSLPPEQDVDGPIFWVGPNRYELLFMDHAAGRQYLARTVDIDRKAPFLMRETVYFSTDGHPKVVAKLGDYRQVEGSQVLAPHHLRMEWVADGSWLDLRFNRMRRSDDERAEKKFVSPRQRGTHLGHMEHVGRPEGAAAPNPAPAER